MKKKILWWVILALEAGLWTVINGAICSVIWIGLQSEYTLAAIGGIIIYAAWAAFVVWYVWHDIDAKVTDKIVNYIWNTRPEI